MSAKGFNHRAIVIHSVPNWLPLTQNWMYTQIRYLPEGIDPHVVCERKSNPDHFEVSNIHCLEEEPIWQSYWDKGMRRLKIRRHLGYLPDTSRKLGAHILHSHFGHYGWAEINAARSAGVKHVVTFYGLDVNFLPRQDNRWLNRYQDLFQHIDLVLCEGPHMAQCIVDLGCQKKKVQVQHLGIRIEEIQFAPRTWQPGEPLRVLIAASFREKKGIPYALEALGRLQNRLNLEITIIGDADKEPRNQQEKQKILEIVERYGFKKIRFLGYQPHARMMEEAYAHHLFLSPSVTSSDGDTEGGAPVSLIEMAASGMMIVSTTHCDIPEIVLHDKTGLLAPERDVDTLVQHLTRLTEHPEQWEDMLIEGRKHVLEQYDAKTQGKRLASLYEDLIGK